MRSFFLTSVLTVWAGMVTTAAMAQPQPSGQAMIRVPVHAGPGETTFPLTTPSMEPSWEDPASIDSSDVMGENWDYLALREANYYQFDMLLWKFSAPSNRGVLIKQDALVPNPTPPPANIFLTVGGYETASPNPDLELGGRITIGRPVNDFFAAEVTGYYVHAFVHQSDLISQPLDATQNPLQVNLLLVPRNFLLTSSSTYFRVEHHGIEANARMLLYIDDAWLVEALAGFRYINHHERFDLDALRTNGVRIRESFRTDNLLFGGQLGVDARWRVVEYAALRSIAKLGYMGNFRDIDIQGTANNGAFVNANNIGVKSSTQDTLMAELGMEAVFYITPNIQLRAGYSGLLLTDVARALDQVDLVGASKNNIQRLDRSQFLWVHGVNAGVEFTY